MPAAATPRLVQHLPLVTLYLTDRCNSRCVTCDYWRHGRDSMSLQSVQSLLPELKRLRTETVLLSGGEPLLHSEWAEIAAAIRANGQKIWLLTSGLSLAKHARRVAEHFDAVTVSLDGTDSSTYLAIRGVDAFEAVCRGIQAVTEAGRPPGIRVTLQQANFRQLTKFVDLAKALQAHSLSFLAVDTENPHAFGRLSQVPGELALAAEELGEFDRLLSNLESRYASDFLSGFIVENPQKLRRIAQYFAARHGKAAYPSVRCNVTEFSAVIGTSGRVQPCFFIAGPTDAQVFESQSTQTVAKLGAVLNDDQMVRLRAAVRSGARAECRTCVCSLWRNVLAS